MKRRLTCAVLALCLLLSGCAATGTTSPQRYSVTWWDVFDTVTVISGYADSEADWNTQMTALHADLLRYNQLYDIYNHYDGMTNLADVNAGAAAAPVAVGDEIMNLLTFAQEMYQATDGACNAAAGAVLRYWHDARTAAGDGAEVSADILPKTADLQAEIAALKAGGAIAAPAPAPAEPDPVLVERLNSVADAIETIAAALERA